jgi:long-chain acyl-CoA synthetase
MTKKSWFHLYPDDVSTEVEIPNISVPEMLQESAAAFSNRLAITFYNTKITYQQLLDMADRFASSLQRIGVKKGDRVAIMLPNSPQYVVSYYGILRVGGIVTQINPMLVERELTHILNDSGAETMVVLDSLYPLVKKVRQQSPVKNVIVVNLEPSENEGEPDVSFDDFLQHGDGKVEEIGIHPAEDLAVLQYTGGTTGRSKGAMLTHRNLVANVKQKCEFFKHTIRFGEEKVLTVIPLFHVYGMTSGMNFSICTGANMILLPRFQLDEVLETIQREQPTLFPGVPTMYVAITNHPKAEEYGIRSIRYCNSGSAPMPLELMKEFEGKTGSIVCEGYGLSEASPTTHCNPRFAERKPGTVGIGLPSTDYKVVDLATGTKELPTGEAGELIIRGPQVMKGYWKMPEETANVLRDGWLYTGDIATVDEEGYVTIIDRKKDMIIASGYNVYPREVEEVLYVHSAVKEAAVVGVPDTYRGETVKAFVVLKKGRFVTEEELLQHCKKHLASYKVPKRVEFRDELPKSGVGKILRRTLAEQEKQKNPR